MAFVKVRDDTGTLELVVFPKTFKDTRNSLIDNKAILVTGRVDFKDEEPAIIVSEINTKDSLSSESGRLFITVPKESSTDNLINLKKILLNNPGNQNVSLVFEGKVKRTVDLNIKISWSQNLSHKITDIFEFNRKLD